MRKFVAPILSITMMVGAVAMMSGCRASAQIGSPPPPKVAPARPAPPPPPPPEPKKEKPRIRFNFNMKGEQLMLPGPVVFETGSDVLRPESDEVLNIVFEYLKQTPRVSLLRIEGHTDMDDKDDKNQVLSEKRAIAVARWLVAKGTDCRRLLPVGFGETRPIAGTRDKQTEEEKAQNRRVAFVNAALEGRPIGGLPVDAGGVVAGDPCK
jgi:OOP family OmpA-OmpF porin